VKLSDVCTDYILHITHERRLAKTTQVGYANYLHHFQEWLKQNGYPEPSVADFTTPALRRYLYAISARGLRPRTIRAMFHPIIGLGKFLVDNSALAENPAKALTMPKKDATRRLLVTDEEVATLLAACERQRNPRDVALSRALLSVLIYAGLRREELLCLHTDDVNFADGCILVRSGKGSRSRVVYVPDVCLTALREWLAFRPQDCKHTFLWARDRSRRIYEYGLVSILETVKAIAGLADHDNIKPHSLRHNYATRLMHNGADIKSIQAALGHAQMATTAIYLHLSEQAAKQVAHLATLPAPPKQQQETDNTIRLPQREAERRRLRRIAR
jgi:site-specific recombinase XerD